MKFSKILILIGILTLLMAGCKKDPEPERAIIPPVDTTPIIDTSPVVEIDTMPAIEEKPGLPSAPLGSGFAVQVASATDEDYARYLVSLWTGRGYEPYVESFMYEGETHYRVRLGIYETLSSAKRMVAELEDKYSLMTWIDPVSN